MDMRVRRHNRAGEHKEARRHRVEIAYRAVGNDADAAEPLVDIGLHLAPERAEALVWGVNVLKHRDARQWFGGDMCVIAEPHLFRLVAAPRMGLTRADMGSAGKGDDRLHLR